MINFNKEIRIKDKDLKSWKIIIADDEEDVHTLTKIVLKDFVFENKNLEIISTFSAEETLEVLKQENDIALVLLDIIMESDDAGLVVAQKLREELHNNTTQIILRTGQAGLIPKLDVVKNYAINDYKEKAKLDSTELLTSIYTSLRSYSNIKSLEENKKIVNSLNKNMKDLLGSYDNNIISTQSNECGELTFISKLYSSISGYSIDELYAQKHKILILNKEEIELNGKIFKYLEKHNTWSGEIKNYKKDSSVYYLFCSLTKEYDDNGIFLFYTSIMQDITLKKEIDEVNKKIEKQNITLAQQSKKSAMGEMIANIAHQWRQPLNNISLIMYYLRDNCINMNKEAINEDVKNCKVQLDYMSKTIDDFTNFIKPNNILVDCNINEIINKVFLITSSSYVQSDIVIIKDIHFCDLNIVENELMQVIINVLNNAKDALKTKDKKIIFVKTYNSNTELIIKIRDNAGGINEEIINRIFEPYFTTKNEKEGIGIGLYLVEDILENKLNGNISVKNIEFKHENIDYIGAEFRISIKLKIPK